jgi:mRNA-degrading endonuclease RelE of RelBE toxin-antitoxin system
VESLEQNPLSSSRRDDLRNIRWRYADHFPYRIVYQVLEEENVVIVVAVLHAARQQVDWKKRLE